VEREGTGGWMSLAYLLARKRTQIRKAEIDRDSYHESGNLTLELKYEARVIRYIEQLMDLELLLERRGRSD
jgi:hypothetical protein